MPVWLNLSALKSSAKFEYNEINFDWSQNENKSMFCKQTC